MIMTEFWKLAKQCSVLKNQLESKNRKAISANDASEMSLWRTGTAGTALVFPRFKLTPPRGDRLVYVSQTMYADAVFCASTHAPLKEGEPRSRDSKRYFNSRPRMGANRSRVNAIRNATSTHTPLCGGSEHCIWESPSTKLFNSRSAIERTITVAQRTICFNSRPSMWRITFPISAVCTCARPDTASTPAFSLGTHPQIPLCHMECLSLR